MAPRDDLGETLARLGERLAREVETWEEKTRADRARAMEKVSQKLSQALLSRDERRELKRKQRDEARAARRREEMENASTPGGIALLMLAMALGVFAFLRPEFWWLVFVALSVGTTGARQLAAANRRSQATLPAALPQAHSAPHEVDALCDRLLADLKASPQAVQAFVQQPEKTVEGLRTTAKALDARRRQLEAEEAPSRLAALATQRAALITQRSGTADPTTQLKLDSALRSLDGQQAALEQLVVATQRVTGEYASLKVMLEELRTRVTVARTTTTPATDGVEDSVRRLNAELEAITESLQSMHAVAPITSEPSADGAADGSGSARVRL